MEAITSSGQSMLLVRYFLFWWDNYFWPRHFFARYFFSFLRYFLRCCGIFFFGEIFPFLVRYFLFLWDIFLFGELLSLLRHFLFWWDIFWWDTFWHHLLPFIKFQYRKEIQLAANQSFCFHHLKTSWWLRALWQWKWMRTDSENHQK